jgi:hypothetical protein
MMKISWRLKPVATAGVKGTPAKHKQHKKSKEQAKRDNIVKGYFE